MKNLIPQFIAERAIQNKYQGRFFCYSMFVDISGFTVMTNDLMDSGKEGAEILSIVIEDIFTLALDSIYKNGGFVATFAGDAFTALFLIEEAEYPLQTAFSIYQLFQTHGRIETKMGDFQCAVKIGLSYGEVEYQIIDAGVQKTFFFEGPAILGCVQSEKKAQDMQIAADNHFISKLRVPVDTLTIDAGYVQIPFCEEFTFRGHYDFSQKSSAQMAVIEKDFLPQAVMKLEKRGEFREIVSCFISFKEEGDYQRVIAQVIQNCYEYGGYFNKIDFGDKGGVFLILFGAPEGREKLYQRGADFALRIRKIPGFQCRIGLATGVAFCGFFGSPLRKEYTALGNVVNLSARIMVDANWGQIRIDSEVANKLKVQYEICFEGSTQFKGFHQGVAVFSLLGPMEKNPLIYADTFIGREDETTMLQECIEPIYNKTFGGVVYIDGPPGIGKSRFMANFEQLNSQAQFLYLPCDEILQKAFNPFSYFLEMYFKQRLNAKKDVNKRVFEDTYAELLNQIPHEEIKKELIRTETIIGALINIEWQDSLYDKLDAKGRFENKIFALKTFFVAQSLIKPTILVIEDGHWIDHDSIEAIKVLLRNVENYPFIVCALCRLKDDGTKVNFVQEDETHVKRIMLSSFKKNLMENLVLDKFQCQKIPQKTLDFIWDKSLGNPFFAEQFILFLQENALLDKDYHVLVEAQTIPEAIHQIIIARIDRLTVNLKETVKTASVLGREFAIHVLKKMLASTGITDNAFKEDLLHLCNQQIWDMVSELTFIFKHALIRDTVYEMQLRENLRELHLLAATAMEELYQDTLSAFYEELAEHYDMTENQDKAIEYLEKAGDQAKENYQNKKALYFYDKVIKYLQEKESKKISLIFLKQGSILELIGQWDEAFGSYKQALAMAKKISDDVICVDCMWHWGNLLHKKGDITASIQLLNEAFQVAKAVAYKRGMSQTTISTGLIYSLQGDYEKAMNCFQQGLDIGQTIGDKSGVRSSIHYMGNNYFYQADYQKAMEHFQQSLVIAQEIGDKSSAGKLYDNIGTICFFQGDYSKAMENKEEAIKISEEIGDKNCLMNTIGNMGTLYQRRKNYTKAMECFKRVLSIGQELDDKKCISYVSNNMGANYHHQGDFANAMECYKRALAIGEILGDKILVYQILVNVGIIYEHQGDYEKAMECFKRSLRIAEEQENNQGILSSFSNFAKIYRMKGEYGKALEWGERVLALGEKMGDKQEISRTFHLLGDIYEEQGKYAKAADSYDRAIQMGRELVEKNNLAVFLYCKASFLFNTSLLDEARELNQEAYEIAKEIGIKDVLFNTFVLKHKIDENRTGLLKMTTDKTLGEEEKGTIYYELWKMTQGREYKDRAMKIYQTLLDKTPKNVYRKRLEEMS